MFRHTLPHSCYLIFHFERPKASVDWVHYFITLVSASPSIKTGDNNPMWTGEVCAPVQLETIVHLLTTGATIPAQVSDSIYHQYWQTLTGLIWDGAPLRSTAYLHVNKKRIFFRPLEIWWQHHLIPKICWQQKSKKKKSIFTNLYFKYGGFNPKCHYIDPPNIR